MKDKIFSIKKYYLPLFSGLLIGTSYIPFFPWAVFFAYIPLWIFTINPQRTLKEQIWGGWWAQFVLNLVGFHWVFHTAHEFGHLPKPVAFIVLILFASLAHLHFSIIGLAYFVIHKWRKLSTSLSLSLLVLLTALAEFFWPYMFKWNMGYVFFGAQFPIYGLADLIGVYGLSFIVLIFNAVFCWAWLHRKQKIPFYRVSLKLVLAFVILNFWGSYRNANWRQLTDTEGKNLKVLAVQANIGNLERMEAERGRGFQDYIAEKYTSLTEQGLKKHGPADLVIWPESAFPDYLDSHYHGYTRQTRFLDFLKRIQTNSIVGGYARDPKDATNPQQVLQSYNALFAFDKSANLQGIYRKTHLLAFGEYTPFIEYFSFLEKIVPAGTGFGRGQGPTVIKIDETIYGPQICYESLDPEFSASSTQQGAQILVNLTNDSWFGDTSEPRQHLYMTLARSVENRRPLVRLTNTGITAAATASGDLLELSPLYSEWTTLYDISYIQNAPLTFYTSYGFLWPWVLIILFIIILVRIANNKNAESEKS